MFHLKKCHFLLAQFFQPFVLRQGNQNQSKLASKTFSRRKQGWKDLCCENSKDFFLTSLHSVQCLCSATQLSDVALKWGGCTDAPKGCMSLNPQQSQHQPWELLRNYFAVDISHSIVLSVLSNCDFVIRVLLNVGLL